MSCKGPTMEISRPPPLPLLMAELWLFCMWILGSPPARCIHMQNNHNSTISRENLVQNTNILYYEPDFNRLQIMEAILIQELAPTINNQNTGANILWSSLELNFFSLSFFPSTFLPPMYTYPINTWSPESLVHLPVALLRCNTYILLLCYTFYYTIFFSSLLVVCIVHNYCLIMLYGWAKRVAKFDKS